MAHTAPQSSPTILHTALQYTAHCTTMYSTLYYTALVTLHTLLLHIVYCSVYTAHTILHTECRVQWLPEQCIVEIVVQHSWECSAAECRVQCITVQSAVAGSTVHLPAALMSRRDPGCTVTWSRTHL